MSSSSSYDRENSVKAAEKVFGPPFAYYKAQRSSSFSPKLFIIGMIFVVAVAIVFLLATNIIIYIRTLDVDDNMETFKHSSIICLSLLGIWLTYRVMVWIVERFGVRESITKNKLYQRVHQEVIELENLLGAEQQENKRD